MSAGRRDGGFGARRAACEAQNVVASSRWIAWSLVGGGGGSRRRWTRRSRARLPTRTRWIKNIMVSETQNTKARTYQYVRFDSEPREAGEVPAVRCTHGGARKLSRCRRATCARHSGQRVGLRAASGALATAQCGKRGIVEDGRREKIQERKVRARRTARGYPSALAETKMLNSAVR